MPSNTTFSFEQTPRAELQWDTKLHTIASNNVIGTQLATNSYATTTYAVLSQHIASFGSLPDIPIATGTAGFYIKFIIQAASPRRDHLRLRGLSLWILTRLVASHGGSAAQAGPQLFADIPEPFGDGRIIGHGVGLAPLGLIEILTSSGGDIGRGCQIERGERATLRRDSGKDASPPSPPSSRPRCFCQSLMRRTPGCRQLAVTPVPANRRASS